MSIWGRFRDDERGVTAVVIAVCLVAVFGAAMLSIDAGNLFQSRRNINTGTDATALAEAGRAAFGGSSAACLPTNVNSMLQNNSGSEATGGAFGRPACEHFAGSPGTGYVVVAGSKPVDVRFGGPVGVGDVTAPSYTGAQYGYITEAVGLRPMGFCVENSHVQEWLNYQYWQRTGTNISGRPLVDDSVYNALGTLDVPNDGHPEAMGPNETGTSYGNRVVHRLYYEKENVAQCGEAPGNWGWFDFNSADNSNSASELRGWILDGYDGRVGVGDCFADETGEPCPGNTGSRGNSGSDNLADIVNTIFAIPLIESAVNPGANADFEVYGFLGVRLMDYRLVPANAAYMDFEFINLLLEGDCCTSTPNNTGIKGVRICSVDHDPQSIVSRCQL